MTSKMRFLDLTPPQIEAACGEYLLPAIVKMCKEAFDDMPTSSGHYSFLRACVEGIRAQQDQIRQAQSITDADVEP